MATSAVDIRFEDLSYTIPAPRPSAIDALRARFSSTKPPARAPTTILHGISGYVAAGKSLAVLGPSGSGKTTFLNLLAARSAHPPSAGSILFGGHPRVARTKRHIGYVMQDDVFFSKLTVRETLNFTADIRLPTALTPQERRERVDLVLRRLRLERCANTRIGDQQFDKGISGGERKRVNIANELLHDPQVLLADECTSGLDSSSAATVVALLRDLCIEGRTVVATIHQPSSTMFALFDNILVLAAGRVAYFGPPAAVPTYFAALGFPFPTHAYNPADYLLELVIDDDAGAPTSPQSRILTAWQTDGPARLASLSYPALPRPRATPRPAPQHLALPVPLTKRTDSTSSGSSSPSSTQKPPPAVLKDPTSPPTARARMARAASKRLADLTGRHGASGEPDKYATDWFRQTRVLCRRALRQKRGAVFQPIYIFQVLAVTVLAALFWFQMDAVEDSIEDRLGALSFFGVFWAFYSTFSAMFAFPAEKQVLNKDRAGGTYRLSAYYFAKTSIETPADTLYPILFSVIVYYTVGFNPYFPSFVLFTIILTLNVLTAQSIGLLISAIAMDVRHAQVAASITILASMLISGYYIDPNNTPEFIKPLRYLSFIKYTYEGMVRVEMLNGRELACSDVIATIYSKNGSRCPIDGNALLIGAQLENSFSIAGNIGILIAWIAVTRTLGYFALKLLHTSHKPRNSSWQR